MLYVRPSDFLRTAVFDKMISTRVPSQTATRPLSPAFLLLYVPLAQRLIDIRQMPTPRQHWAIGPNVTFPDDTDHNLVGSAIIARPPTPSTPPSVPMMSAPGDTAGVSLPIW